jgi:hypothetical protein
LGTLNANNPGWNEGLATLASALTTIFIYLSGPIIIGMILVSWWRKSHVLTLWWLSLGLVGTVIPLLMKPMITSEVTYLNIHPVTSMIRWTVLFILLLLWSRSVWQSQHDGLLVSFGTFPLAIRVVTHGLEILSTNNPLNYYVMSTKIYKFESIFQILMWCALAIVYFGVRNRWQRWLGMGTTAYIYLSVVTYLVLIVPSVALSGAIYYVATIWIVVTLALLVGLWLDQRVISHRGLPA